MSIDKKKYFGTEKIKGQIQKAISYGTAKALTVFCEQKPEYQQYLNKIYKRRKTA